MNYQPLLLSHQEAKAMQADLERPTLLGQALQRDMQQVESYITDVGIEVPGHGEAGGYEHNRHKQNYIHMDIAARLFLITESQHYRDYVVDMLTAYANIYPSLESHTSKDTNPPGRLFHQTLNENMWMLYASCAYSCVYTTLDPEQRQHIERDLFEPMIDLFVVTYGHDFDIVHNHGLWAVAAVGICGYAINRQDVVDKALYGLKLDGESGGFLAQLAQLFSPDGYYMEGPYYHRFSLRPIYLFAEAIARRQPEIDIYNFNQQVIKTTSYAVFKTAFPDGCLPALNDSSKTININDEGVIMATSVCFHQYEANPNLLAMAEHQKDVWVHASGKRLSDALADTKAQGQTVAGFDWGSVLLRDGAQGEKGGVAILRRRVEQQDSMALMWFGGHGSDSRYHSALDHGHFDGLHLSLFNRGHEVLHDYGFGRWVNVEPKFGGRYIPENKSYCKQTVAHNTVVVDQKTQNQAKTDIAEATHGQGLIFAIDNLDQQVMAAKVSEYYPGVTMTRSVALLNLVEFEAPLLIDVFALDSESSHQYDLPFHHSGQLMNTDVEVTMASALHPLGDSHGYQHLWHLGQAQDCGQGQVTWLHDSSFYTASYAMFDADKQATSDGSLHLVRTGANDPDFNLRSEPGFILRQQVKSGVFASVIETHGHFDESMEVSLNATSGIKGLTVLASNAQGCVLEWYGKDGQHYRYGVSFGAVSGVHQVSDYQWQGAVQRLS